MSLLKEFDLAIADVENIPRGFVTDKGNYDSYMSNAAWDDYLKDMSDEHRSQFDDGSGGELKEKNGRPPKMASFASSSRMIYMLSHNIPGFTFEKQLPTVVGGIANLDGYHETEQSHIFVEAKCREPYSHNAVQTIKQNYGPVYEYLSSKMPEIFSCTMEDVPDSRDMRVEFFCQGNSVASFDIKQMICHLLGVANEMLKSGSKKSILFLYLLYDPTELQLPTESKSEITQIYKDTCNAANNYRFEEMFGHIVDFLVQRSGSRTDSQTLSHIKNTFRFALCSQKDYATHLR